MKKVTELQEYTLQNLYKKVDQLQYLQNKIKSFLPSELRQHCSVANFEKGILVFAVQSASWAVRLGYLKSDLVSQLRCEAGIPQLVSIEYYIEPEFVALFGKITK